MKKILPVFMSAILAVAVTGCLKDKDYDDHKYGIKDTNGSPVGVGFPQSTNKINVTSVENVTTSQTIHVALVNFLSDEPASQDLHITLVDDQSVVDNYNTNNNPDVVAMPASAYNIPSMVVTIPKGQRTGTLTITIPNAKDQLDITKTYGFGFRIASVQEGGVTIASNIKTILVGVAIKNKWDGVYEIVGSAVRGGDPDLTGPFGPIERSLITAGATTVQWDGKVPWGHSASQLPAGYEPAFTIDEATNKVTVSSPNGAVRNDPDYDSRYDPATKTIYAQWTYGAGPTGPSARRFTDTAVYLRPR